TGKPGSEAVPIVVDGVMALRGLATSVTKDARLTPWRRLDRRAKDEMSCAWAAVFIIDIDSFNGALENAFKGEVPRCRQLPFFGLKTQRSKSTPIHLPLPISEGSSGLFRVPLVPCYEPPSQCPSRS